MSRCNKCNRNSNCSCGCGCGCNCDSVLEENQICCCNTVFSYSLELDPDTNIGTLIVTPCSQPTAVFDVATISLRTNACTTLSYYQSAVNTDPVEIIQDCNLNCIICRSIQLYMNNNGCGCDSCYCNNDNRRISNNIFSM